MEGSSIDILTEWDIVTARQVGRKEAKSIGFDIIDQALIATAISELARNIHLYAESGKIEVKKIIQEKSVGIYVIASDNGPGIPRIDELLQKDLATTKGIGFGLPGVKRIMDEFQLDSQLTIGTTVKIKKWLSINKEE